MKRFLPSVLLLGLIGMYVPAQAATLKMDSGEQQVQLLELYTSQGCSSCPPAERWLNALTQSDDLWKNIVPLAFHVDYWDYLGWKDRYASKRFSQRQRQQRLQGAVSSVYTPGFVVDGREWRGWFSRRALPDRLPGAGRLVASLSDGELHATYSGASGELTLNIALLGFGIVDRIRAGENHGADLPQEFVVLTHAQHLSNDGSWRLNMPANPYPDIKRLAVALWVTPKDSLQPLQATGGWLAKK